MKARPGLPAPVRDLAGQLFDIMRLTEGIVLLWPVFLALQSLRGRSEGLTAGEWLWVIAWLCVVLLTALAAWDKWGALPDWLKEHATRPRSLYYLIVTPAAGRPGVAIRSVRPGAAWADAVDASFQPGPCVVAGVAAGGHIDADEVRHGSETKLFLTMPANGRTFSIMRKLTAELVGTFILVFAGTGAIITNEVSGGTVSHVGVSLSFGLVVLAMVYAIGDVSGAHLNPAVTLGFFAARRFAGRSVVPYIASQCVGAVLASIVLRLLFPTNATLGATLPAGDAVRSFVLEAILTFILMFVILSVSTGPKEKGVMAGIAIGEVIALEALFAGPISGASMNPARSLAPALVSLRFDYLWIYLTAPLLGALASVAVCRCVQEQDCCCPLVAQEPAR